MRELLVVHVPACECGATTMFRVVEESMERSLSC